MNRQLVRAVAVTLALFAVAAASPLLLASDAASVLSPGASAERVVNAGPAGVTAADAPARFTFTRDFALDPARHALVIVAPNAGYDAGEIAAVNDFLRAGGRVLVADDGGVGADFLARLGAGVTSGTARVYTPAFNATPRDIVTLATGEIPALPSEVVLARPTLVQGGTPVLVAPELAWEDANDNGRPDLGERVDRGFVLAARTPVGAGELLVVGDPDAVDAERFPVAARALLRHVAEDGARVLVFDEAHRPLSNPMGLNALLSGQPGTGAGTGMLITAVVVAALTVLAPRFERPPKRPAAPRGMDSRALDNALGELDTE